MEGEASIEAPSPSEDKLNTWPASISQLCFLPQISTATASIMNMIFLILRLIPVGLDLFFGSNV